MFSPFGLTPTHIARDMRTGRVICAGSWQRCNKFRAAFGFITVESRHVPACLHATVRPIEAHHNVTLA